MQHTAAEWLTAWISRCRCVPVEIGSEFIHSCVHMRITIQRWLLKLSKASNSSKISEASLPHLSPSIFHFRKGRKLSILFGSRPHLPFVLSLSLPLSPCYFLLYRTISRPEAQSYCTTSQRGGPDLKAMTFHPKIYYLGILPWVFLVLILLLVCFFCSGIAFLVTLLPR